MASALESSGSYEPQSTMPWLQAKLSRFWNTINSNATLLCANLVVLVHSTFCPVPVHCIAPRWGGMDSVAPFPCPVKMDLQEGRESCKTEITCIWQKLWSVDIWQIYPVLILLGQLVNYRQTVLVFRNNPSLPCQFVHFSIPGLNIRTLFLFFLEILKLKSRIRLKLANVFPESHCRHSS